AQGALTGTGVGADRVGVLPVTTGSVGLVVMAGAAAAAATYAGAPCSPWALAILVVLPWLPLPLPPVLLTWARPLGQLIWIAIALAVLGRPAPSTRAIPPPRRAAGLAARAISALSAWQVSPPPPGGDEPHYLIITQSLLKDHDLKIENNH